MADQSRAPIHVEIVALYGVFSYLHQGYKLFSFAIVMPLPLLPSTPPPAAPPPGGWKMKGGGGTAALKWSFDAPNVFKDVRRSSRRWRRKAALDGRQGCHGSAVRRSTGAVTVGRATSVWKNNTIVGSEVDLLLKVMVCSLAGGGGRSLVEVSSCVGQ